MLRVMSQVMVTSTATSTSTAGNSRITRCRARDPAGMNVATSLRSTVDVQQVAEPSYRLDAGARAVEPLAQTVHVDLDGVLGEVGVPGGKGIDDLTLGDHPARAHHEHFQNGKFTHGQ